MKTLQQIEPRVPISSLPFVIDAPGHYYLTGDLEFTGGSNFAAIRILADYVTLDLNGFRIFTALASAPPAVYITGARRSVTVRHGSIVGQTVVTESGSFPNKTWSATAQGFSHGVVSEPGAVGLRLEGLAIVGCREHGAWLVGNRHTVIDCQFRSNGFTGLFANNSYVERSTAVGNRWTGLQVIAGQVVNCAAESNGSDGFLVSLSHVRGSVAARNGIEGFLGVDATLSECVADSNQGEGFDLAGGSVTGCAARGNGATGVYAPRGAVSQSTAESNWGHGIEVDNGTVINSAAHFNRQHGIKATNGVIAFCRAGNNNQSSGGFTDITGSSATRTGNFPAP